MKKMIGQDHEAEFATAGAPDTDDLASPPGEPVNVNAELVEYLNALMTSVPPLNTDFSGIRFLCSDASEPGSSGSALVDDVVFRGAERLKNEANELRSDNYALQLKVARLTAQLNESECNLDAIAAEKDELKSTIGGLREQLRISTLAVEKATRRALEIQAFIDAKAGREKDRNARLIAQVSRDLAAERLKKPAEKPPALQLAESAERFEAVSLESIEALQGSAEVTQAREAARLEATTVEAPQESAAAGPGPDAEVVVPADPGRDLPSPQQAPFPGIPGYLNALPSEAASDAQGGSASRAEWKSETVSSPEADEKGRLQAPADGIIFSSRTAVSNPTQRTRPASRVIKRHDPKHPQTLKERDEVAQQNLPAAAAASKAETLPKKHPLPWQPATMPLPEADRPAPEKDLLPPVGMEETGMEPAPDTKVVARKHIENYRQIQKEADSPETATGHDTIGKA